MEIRERVRVGCRLDPSGLDVLEDRAGSEFVESGVDGGTSPTKDLLGLAGRTVAVLEGRFRLEPPSFVTGKRFRRRLDRLNDVFRECCHGRLLLERRH